MQHHTPYSWSPKISGVTIAAGLSRSTPDFSQVKISYVSLYRNFESFQNEILTCYQELAPQNTSP